MANAREIQSRMKSIKDTMKITNAMYMVSSSKLQKARKELNKTKPYFNMIQDSLAKLLEEAPEASGEFFNTREHKKGAQRMAGYLVITADKGLAGAYNHNVTKLAEKIALNEEADMLFVVGQQGRHYFETKDIPIDISFNYTAQNPTMNRARHIATRLLELFVEEKIDDLYILYTKTVNSMTVQAVSRKILPLRAERITPIENDLVDHYEGAAFIPDANTVFEHIVPDYITGFIFGALVESYCSEHNSRMLAMQTATESAQKMLKELSIKYNRARQAAITQEITEVVGGSKHSN
ncbi:MAG: ATP synthase F1 subunit gamma [Eubacterium sp.]|nr:ATP synthase F1 subunit gamma [Eubacterium sp.]MBR4241040.1 ATP synthase F1 subunit gamma [Eubacterium sp.]